MFVFDSAGKFLFQVGKKGNTKGCFNLISSVCIGPGGSIIVADTRIQIFSPKGDLIEEIGHSDSSKSIKKNCILWRIEEGF